MSATALREAPASAMKATRAETAADLVAALLVLLAVAFELGLRETFFQISSEAPRLLVVAVLVVVCALTSWRLCWLLRGGVQPAHWTSRAMPLLALGCWLLMVGVGWPGGLWTGGTLLFFGAVAALRFDGVRWRLLRRAGTVAALVFVFSQPLLARLRAVDVVWPRLADSRSTDVRAMLSETIVVVLLDELSARAAGPIADAMARSGQPVLRRSLKPVGDGTAKVVPALLSQLKFNEVKPCGRSTLCSGSNVLDFDRIRASRPDIDIVGFYMPYCRIAGLRSCEVHAPSEPYLDAQRWRCAALRRSVYLAHLEGSALQERCATLNGEVWSDLGARIESALWRAPVWAQGGLLFVHSTLPHPPGEGGAGTLDQHYRVNIAKAARLVGAITERLASQGRSYTLIVFSDHPLRVKSWCQSTQYRATCPISEELEDEDVPLLATGRISPALELLTSNAEIFDALGSVAQPR